MPKLTQFSSGKSPQKIIVFGPPKAGKTKIIGDLAEEFNLIWFDLESGIDTLLQLPAEYQERITVIKIRDTVDAPRAHATIDKILSGGTFNICDNHGSVDCAICKADTNEETTWTQIEIPTVATEQTLKTVVVIDSGSQLTISVNSTVNKLLNTTIRVESISDRKDRDGFAEWDNQGKYLNRMMSAIQNAPFHVAITAHELECEREDGSVRLVPSIGTRNYAVTVAKFFGHIIYMDKVNLVHKAWSSTGYSNKVLTGSRLDVATEGMNKPSLLPIFRGEVGAGMDTRKATAQHVMSTMNDKAQGVKTSMPFKLPGAKQ